jgi:hypothetical protein
VLQAGVSVLTWNLAIARRYGLACSQTNWPCVKSSNALSRRHFVCFAGRLVTKIALRFAVIIKGEKLNVKVRRTGEQLRNI